MRRNRGWFRVCRQIEDTADCPGGNRPVGFRPSPCPSPRTRGEGTQSQQLANFQRFLVWQPLLSLSPHWGEGADRNRAV
jgi:hypothetical protein